MLKKKNIAMMMAVATVATTAAPAFASTIDVQKVDEAKMIADVQEMLDTKYTDSTESGSAVEGTIQAGQEYKNSVYILNAVTIDPLGAQVGSSIRIENVSMLKAEIEKAKVAGNDITVQVTDKGHKEVDGEIVATEVTKNRSYNATFVDTVVAANTLANGAVATVKGSTVLVTADDATITLPSGVVIELLEGDYILDLSKPVDANGNAIDAAISTVDDATAKKVAGFELAEDAGDATIKDIPSKRVADLVISGRIEITENLSDLVTEQGYTEKGADLVNFFVDAQTAGSTIVKDGVKYNLGTFDPTAPTELTAVAPTKDGYAFEASIEVTTGTVTGTIKNVKIIVEGETQAEVQAIRDAIVAANNVVPGNFTALAGDDRFETATAVSKSYYKGKSDAVAVPGVLADAVVLVGENAIVDGLAAAPLAAQKNAPILLTKKDEVPAETMNEIKRIVASGKDVYLIGGENTISKEVEAQLVEEMNANIIRVEGEDRFETSIAIAEKLGTDIGTKAYVVGGTGLADAMSIAALASKDQDPTTVPTIGPVTNYEVAPIIVTPEAGLTKDAKYYLKDSTIATVEVVGGTSHVSTDVLKDIEDITSTAGVLDATRIAGDDRNDTNAKVIAGVTTNSVDKVYIAKDGDTQLVDALAAAPIAGRSNGVIALATNDTTKAQDVAISKAAGTTNNSLTQVGNGIADTLVQKIANLLGI